VGRRVRARGCAVHAAVTAALTHLACLHAVTGVSTACVTVACAMSCHIWPCWYCSGVLCCGATLKINGV
jgi:hypothetical protein